MFQSFADLLRCTFRGPSNVSLSDVIARGSLFLEQSPFDIGMVYNLCTMRISSATYSLQQIMRRNLKNRSRNGQFLLKHLLDLFDNPQALLASLLNNGVNRSVAYVEEVLPLPYCHGVLNSTTAYRRVIPDLVLNGFVNVVSVVSVLFLSADTAVAILSFQPCEPAVRVTGVMGPVKPALAAAPPSVFILNSPAVTASTRINDAVLFPQNIEAPSIYKRRLLTSNDAETQSLFRTLAELGKPCCGERNEGGSNKRQRPADILDSLRHSTTDSITLISAIQTTVPKRPHSSYRYPCHRGWAAGAEVKQDDETCSTDCENTKGFKLSTSTSRFELSSGFETPLVENALFAEYATAPMKTLSPDPFTRKLRSYLERISFDAIEIWVPVKTNGSNIMLFGGFASKDDRLQGWSVYSRSFVFEEKVGIPGRLSSSELRGSLEHYSDLTALPERAFLRLQGARLFGLHASLAFPLSSRHDDIYRRSSSSENEGDEEEAHTASSLSSNNSTRSGCSHISADSSQKSSSVGQSNASVVAIMYSTRVFAVSADLIDDTVRNLKSMKISSRVNHCEFTDDL
jgi:hypothetical protein